MVACEHCGHEMKPCQIPAHVKCCLHNPTVRERVREFLTRDGKMMTRNEYKRAQPGSGCPSESAMYKQMGSWTAVVQFLGLEPIYVSGRAVMQCTDAEIDYQISRNRQAIYVSDWPLEACGVRETEREVIYMLR